MKMKELLLLLTVLTTGTHSFAQGHSGAGGGNWTEAKIKNQMQDLIPYLASDEGKQKFPEIVAYDQNHPEESFTQIIQNTAPVLWNGPKQEKFDHGRDCIAHIETKNRFFKCNANALPDLTKENEPDFSRFWFHEALVQAYLETDRGAEVPSTYTISSRLEFHLEVFEKWMPGKTASAAKEAAEIAAMDTVVTMCKVTRSTANWGLWIPVNDQAKAEYNQYPYDFEFLQVNPSKSQFRGNEQGNGLYPVDGARIKNSAYQKEAGLLSKNGLILSTHLVSHGTVKLVFKTETGNSLAILEAKAKDIPALTHAKKFKAQLTAFTNSGEYGTADLICVNALN